MPTRDYQGFSIASGSRGTAPVAGAPLNVTRPVPEQGPTVAGQVLQGLLKVGGAIADKNLENEIDDAYIEGQRQRSLGTAVEDIQGDAVMAPFLRGGYATQDYRLAQAKFAQDTQNFIAGDGRAIAPEEFAKSIAEGSSAITKDVSTKLPRAERANALASQAQTEQALIHRQAKEHAKYGLEQVSLRYSTQGNQINADLTKARDAGDSEAYTQAAGRAALFLQDVLTGPSLPQKIRAGVATDYVLSVLGTDHADLVEQVIGAGLLDALPGDARFKISGALRESRSRTIDIEAIGTMESNGRLLARIALGDADIDEVRAHTEKEMRAKRMKVNEAENVFKLFYMVQAKGGLDGGGSGTQGTAAAAGPALDEKANLYAALDAGDLQAIHTMGSSPADAIMVRDKAWLKAGNSVAAVTLEGIKTGIKLGSVPSKLGTRVQDALFAMAANPDDVNAEQASLVRGSIALVQQMQAQSPESVSRFLAAIPEEGRAVMAYVLDTTSQGGDPLKAMREATTKTGAYKALSESDKRAASAGFNTRLLKALDDRFENSFVGRTKELLSPAEAATASAGVQGQLYMAATEEVHRLSRNPDNLALLVPGDKPEAALINTALANVQRRTLRIARSADPSTAGGTLLVLPADTSAAALFGDVNLGFVGEELSKRYPALSKDVTSEFQAVRGPDGRYQLLNRQIGADGVSTQDTVVDLKGLNEVVTARADALYQEKYYADGGGGTVPVKGTDGKRINLGVDGRNEVGMGRTTVYKWRKFLLSHLPPTVPSTADAVTTAAASEEFAQRTNAALNGTIQYTKDMGARVGGLEHIYLANIFLSAGPSDSPLYKELRSALDKRDAAAFLQAANKSPWAKWDKQATPLHLGRLEAAMQSSAAFSK